MKKTLITLMLTSVISSNATAEFTKCADGYNNLDHLSSCLGRVVDSGIGILADLPSNAQDWSKEQHNKAKQKLENIKNEICSNVKSSPAKKVIVEKIVYKDKIVEKIVYKDKIIYKDKIVEKIVYKDRAVKAEAKVKVATKAKIDTKEKAKVDTKVAVEASVKVLKRRCVTKKQSDNFGHTQEIITCTEWK
jgi:hypothetical protein